MIGAKLVYIGNDDYLNDLKKPNPGHEKLYFVDDPYKVFGNIEKDKAIYLFNAMDYTSAFRIFENLDSRVPGTNGEYAALKYISKAYNSWDNLNIKDAKINLEKSYNIICRDCKIQKNYTLSSSEEKIKNQLNILAILEKLYFNKDKDKNIIFDDIHYLIGSLYENAFRR